MKNENYILSNNIKDSLISKKSNPIYDKVLKFFFRKLNFDEESLHTLQEYADKDICIFISYQGSPISLFLFLIVLKKNNIKIPHMAFDYRSALLQPFRHFFRNLFYIIVKLFSKKKSEYISDSKYISKTLNEEKNIVISLLTKRAFRKRYLEIKSDTLQHLVEYQKNYEKPIYLFPKIIFWNRNPERTKTLVTSRATGSRGLFSAVFTMLKSATPAFIRIAPPVNLKEEIKNSSTDDNKIIARNLREKLLELYSHEKRTILGPVIKTKQEMMEKVLFHKNVMDTISNLSNKKKGSEKKLRKKAFKYFNEIAADFSILYIKMFDWTLDYIYRKIFDGFNYNIEEFKKIREASQKGPLILMPSHKSHMDYLILSSIFYRNKIIPPHILSGSNLTFFPMGKIFRRSGAFFMRRSFKGLDLYSSVFKQYVKTLINEGYSIEFFIEGGRTRTGKINLPKMGMMKYLIESIEEGYNKDMVFVPLAINYDRILEESSYQKELKGKEKKNESTSSFVKSRKYLKRQYGKVYLSFNEPFSYNEIKEKFKNEDDFMASLGQYLTRKISDVIMITPFTITSAAILLLSLKGFSKEMLKERLLVLHDYLKYSNANLSKSLEKTKNIDEIIDYVIESYQQDNIINELEFEGIKKEDTEEHELLFVLNEDDRARINFYKNNIIHYLLSISFVANAVLTNLKNKSASLKSINKSYIELKEFFSSDFVYPESMDDTDKSIEDILNYFEKKDIVKLADNKVIVDEDKKAYILFYSRVIQDFIESYFIVASALIELNRKENNRDLIIKIRKNGVKMYHLGEIKLIESLSMPNYKNALNQFKALNLIKEEKISKKVSEIQVIDSERMKCHMDSIGKYLNNLL